MPIIDTFGGTPVLTPEQIETRERLIKRNGKPLREYENKLLGCYFMEYPHILIGIEKDGHPHS
jgi:hypothetical protein